MNKNDPHDRSLVVKRDDWLVDQTSWGRLKCPSVSSSIVAALIVPGACVNIVPVDGQATTIVVNDGIAFVGVNTSAKHEQRLVRTGDCVELARDSTLIVSASSDVELLMDRNVTIR